MKTIKTLVGLFFMIGMPFPILFADQPHQIYFTTLAYVFSFLGTGILYGFSNFRTRPEHIGNFDDDKITPKINQTWMMWFISAVINLTVANLF